MLPHGTGEVLRDRVLQRLLPGGVETDAGFEDPPGRFAGSEAGETDLFGDLLEGRVHGTIELRIVHLDRQLDLVALEGLERALHREPSVPAGCAMALTRSGAGNSAWTRVASVTMRAMSFWKPHALAKPHADQLDLRIGDRVTSKVDLPGVAAGTAGKVILANGFNWQRYRVLFAQRRRAG